LGRAQAHTKPSRHKAKTGKIPNSYLCGSIKYDINPLHKRIPWHSGRITIETVTNETGLDARGAMKSRVKRRRKLRNAKLSAPRPKLQRMTSRINGQVWIMTSQIPKTSAVLNS
jgi:hypothetical protein